MPSPKKQEFIETLGNYYAKSMNKSINDYYKQKIIKLQNLINKMSYFKNKFDDLHQQNKFNELEELMIEIAFLREEIEKEEKNELEQYQIEWINFMKEQCS